MGDQMSAVVTLWKWMDMLTNEVKCWCQQILQVCRTKSVKQVEHRQEREKYALERRGIIAVSSVQTKQKISESKASVVCGEKKVHSLGQAFKFQTKEVKTEGRQG